VRVAAIDCDEDEEMCEEFSVYGVPQIMAFTENFRDDGEKYLDKYDWKKLSAFATKKMQDFVSVVTLTNYNDFFEREKEIQKVLVFTDKKTTPAVFKALSKQYKGKLAFGHVRESETQIIKNYKVTKFPTIIIVSNPYDNQGEMYPSEDYSMKAF